MDEVVASNIITQPLQGENLLREIIRQVEYYFSDANLPKDKFLLEQMSLDQTGEGFVDIGIISTFRKITNLTSDLNLIIKALGNSSWLQLSADRTKIKRRLPFYFPKQEKEKEDAPLHVDQSLDYSHCIYLSYLPKEISKQGLIDMFAPIATVRRVDLPFDKKTKEIKGIAFVEFHNENDAVLVRELSATGRNPLLPPGVIVKPYLRKKEKDSKDVSVPPKETSLSIPQPTSQQPPSTSHPEPEVPKKERSGRKRSKSTNPDPSWEPKHADQRPTMNLARQKYDPSIPFVPIRQPRGPDGTKGFSIERGNLHIS